MKIIKLKLLNFKRFEALEIPFDKSLNIFVGDNESGKSTILQALDLVIRGSRHLIEDLGLERLFNKNAIDQFMNSNQRNPKSLPIMRVELFFDETNDPFMNGKNNSCEYSCDGIRLICEPDNEYSKTIANILASPTPIFPFEYYKISFSTFSGESYNGYKRPLRSILVDNSNISSEFAMSQYIRDVFKAALSDDERTFARYEYRSSKDKYQENSLAKFSEKLPGYSFSVKDTSKDNLDSDLTIKEDGIDIYNKGTGKQCLIKAALALKQTDKNIDVVLLEEPENHLSHLNMNMMIQTILASKDKQLFIATHSDLIATRLDLRKCVIMNSRAATTTRLEKLSSETATFFMKAPDNNLLQYILSDKSILVEGDAEFILMDTFCNSVLRKKLYSAGINVISVDGKCFKRYLEIAKCLNIKTAVITDNDKDYDKNIKECYYEYINDEYSNIKIFADTCNDRHTFEICVYKDNQEFCDTLFESKCRSRSVEEYMLANKAECAFCIASNIVDTINVPDYIEEAIRWIGR